MIPCWRNARVQNCCGCPQQRTMPGITARGPPPQLHVEVQAPVAESDLVSLNHQVESKAIDGYLWLNVQPGQAVPEATYVSRGSADFFGADKMQGAIGDALVREALMNHGVASGQADGLVA